MAPKYLDRVRIKGLETKLDLEFPGDQQISQFFHDKEGTVMGINKKDRSRYMVLIDGWKDLPQEVIQDFHESELEVIQESPKLKVAEFKRGVTTEDDRS